jgi:hypothetical protein
VMNVVRLVRITIYTTSMAPPRRSMNPFRLRSDPTLDRVERVSPNRLSVAAVPSNSRGKRGRGKRTTSERRRVARLRHVEEAKAPETSSTKVEEEEEAT